MISKKKVVSLLLSVAIAASPVYAQAASGEITGSVTSAGNKEGKITLSLLQNDIPQPVQIATVGNSTYVMKDVEAGEYTLKATKYNHVPREYKVTVSNGSITQNVELYLQGDVTGNGKVNVGDVAKAYSHARRSALLTDPYILRCADMNQDSKINVGDVAKIYSLVRNPESATEIPPIPSKPLEDYKDDPIELGGILNFEAEVSAGHLSYYKLYRVSGTNLTIENPMAYVIYNGVTYEAKDGTVTVPELYSDSTNTPTCIAIGNRGTQDLVFPVSMSYPEGHRMNPLPLPMGPLSTYCKEGDSQGVYYSFTATQAGKLTIRKPAADCNITVTSTVVEGGTRSVSLSDNPEKNSLTFSMSEGETVIVCVVMNPQNGFNYPEATVTTTVRFL